MEHETDTRTKAEKVLDAAINHFWWIGIAVITAIIAIYGITFDLVFKQGISKDTGHWGTFGDFVGGVANPIIALLALVGLIRTVQIQQKEFKEMQKELSAQERQLAAQASALEAQSESMKNQQAIMRQDFLTNSFKDAFERLLNDVDVLSVQPFPSKETFFMVVGNRGHQYKTLKEIKDVLESQNRKNLTNEEYKQTSLSQYKIRIDTLEEQVKFAGNMLAELQDNLPEANRNPIFAYYSMCFYPWAKLLKTLGANPHVIFKV